MTILSIITALHLAESVLVHAFLAREDFGDFLGSSIRTLVYRGSGLIMVCVVQEERNGIVGIQNDAAIERMRPDSCS